MEWGTGNLTHNSQYLKCFFTYEQGCGETPRFQALSIIKAFTNLIECVSTFPQTMFGFEAPQNIK